MTYDRPSATDLAFSRVLGETLVITDVWADLHAHLETGEISAEEAVRKFNEFLFPIVLNSAQRLLIMGDASVELMDLVKVILDKERANALSGLARLMDGF